MEVILLEKVRNLGDLGKKVVVKRGYGRNFLIPSGKAVSATKENLADFEAKRVELEQRAADQLAKAKKRADSLKDLSIKITANASDEGKLYGSIGTREIANAVTSAGVEVEKSEVRMPQGVIRYIGEYEIELQLHSDVAVPVKINIITEA